MHRFRKGQEPVKALAAARKLLAEEEARAGASLADPWTALPFDKQSIREALCRDQGHLCAYCGRSIEPTERAMIIEHWVPRSVDSGQVFAWANLLGVCLGTYEQRTGKLRGHAFTVRHCDQHRTPKAGLFHQPAQLPLQVLRPFRVELMGPSPHEAGIKTEAELVAHMAKVGARLRGWLDIDPKHRCVHHQATSGQSCVAHDIAELNLNALRLVNERATVIARLREELAQRPGKERRFIEARIRAAKAKGTKLPAYAHIELGYLRRKARAHNLTASKTGSIA